MTQTLTKVVADFQTSLRYAVVGGDTTATLSSATDEDGVVLSSGTYGFTIDGDNDSKEYIVCTLVSTALTSVVSISRQGVITSGFSNYHRPGAKVEITDWAALYRINTVLSVSNQFDSGTLIGYDAPPVGLSGNNFATVAYVLSVVNGGTVAFDQQIISGIAGEVISSGNVVYLKASDQRWYLSTAETTTTTEGITLGIAQSAGTVGNSMTILISGIASNVSGLSAGTIYYVGTNGALTTSSSSNVARVGLALSATSILIQSRYLDAQAGTAGIPGANNKYITQRSTPLEVDQSQLTQNSSSIVGAADTTGLRNKLAQSFIPSEISTRAIELYKSADSGSFTGTVTIALQANSGGSPSGVNLGAVTITNASWLLIPTGAFQISFTSDVALTVGSLYWIVISTSTSDSTNHPNVGINTAGGYASGSVKLNNTADGWVTITTIDLYFKVFSGVTSKVVALDANNQVPVSESNFSIIDMNVTPASTTGTTETTVYSKLIPAGVFNINTGVYVRGYAAGGRDSTSTGSNPIMKVKLNDTTLATLDLTVIDTGSANTSGNFECFIINSGSLSSQKYAGSWVSTSNAAIASGATTAVGNIVLGTAISAGTSAVDTSQPVLLTITMQQLVSGTGTLSYAILQKIG